MRAPPILVIGAGGHAKVIAESLLNSGQDILGFCDIDPEKAGNEILGLPVLGDDDVAAGYSISEIRLANGIGSTGQPESRRRVFERFSDKGHEFVTIRDSGAVIASDVELGAGAQVMAGCVIQPSTRVGRNCIINTGACVDHDCTIGDHVHIAPGAVICGGVNVGDGTHIGAGAVLIQEITIGPDAVVGAGAVVLNDVPANSRVGGVPAKALKP